MRIVEPNLPWSPYPMGITPLMYWETRMDTRIRELHGFGTMCRCVSDEIPDLDRGLEKGLAPLDRRMHCYGNGCGVTRTCASCMDRAERVSSPYVDYEISDGIPKAIGTEDVTKPGAPASSTVVFSESERRWFEDGDRRPCTSRIRSSGVRW